MTTVKNATDSFTQLAHTVSQFDADYAVRHRNDRTALYAASTKKDTTVLPLFYADKARTIKGFRLAGRVTTAKAAGDIDYSGVALVYDDGAGAGATTLASMTNKLTGGSAITAGQILSIAVNDTMIVPAGKFCYLQLTTAGAGLEINPFDGLVDSEIN